MGLCRSQRRRGDAQHANELLSAVYATFTEGFTTPDLIDAAHLLEGPPAAAPSLAFGQPRQRD